MSDNNSYFPALNDVMTAEHTLAEILSPTPLMHNRNLSERYGADIMLKREDLQMVRSYKIRGAYNKIRSLAPDRTASGIVCASAGNHAQGVALSCNKLGIAGKIFMPVTTPKQKINQVKMFGGEFVEVVLTGDTFDQANAAAVETCEREGKTFIPPFNDPKIIEGQGTVGLEILQQSRAAVDYIFVPIGGGGLASGIGSVYKQMSPQTKIIGVEPAGAAGMKLSFERGEVTELDRVEKFVDGAAVQRVGDLTFDICRQVLDDIVVVPEGKVCTTILSLYNFDAIVVEPAGALSISALDLYRDKIEGKNVVCVVSGSNNATPPKAVAALRGVEALLRGQVPPARRSLAELREQRSGAARRYHLLRIQEEDQPREGSCAHRNRVAEPRRLRGADREDETPRHRLRISERQPQSVRIPDRIMI